MTSENSCDRYSERFIDEALREDYIASALIAEGAFERAIQYAMYVEKFDLALALHQRYERDLPFLALTDEMPDCVVAQLQRLGADDYYLGRGCWENGVRCLQEVYRSHRLASAA